MTALAILLLIGAGTATNPILAAILALSGLVAATRTR